MTWEGKGLGGRRSQGRKGIGWKNGAGVVRQGIRTGLKEIMGIGKGGKGGGMGEGNGRKTAMEIVMRQIQE